MNVSLSEIYIRGKDFEKIAIIDDAKSVIWTERYDECGDFEIYVHAESAVFNQHPSFIWCYVTHDDSTMVGMIETQTIETTEDQERYVILSGRCLVGLLSNRVITNTEDFQNRHLDHILTTLVTDNIISASVEARNVEILGGSMFLVSTSSMPRISGNYFGQNLYECVITLCRRYHYGIRTIPVYAEDSLYELDEVKIQFYEGVDRTGRSWINSESPVIFSKENDNLKDYTYKRSITDQVSDALVSNSGDTPSTLTTVFAGHEFVSITRKEIYVKSNTKVSGSYLEAALESYGWQEIMKNNYEGLFEANVSDVKTYEYRTHYNLGDIVIVKLGNGKKTYATVAEVTECLDETGYHLIPKLKY